MMDNLQAYVSDGEGVILLWCEKLILGLCQFGLTF